MCTEGRRPTNEDDSSTHCRSNDAGSGRSRRKGRDDERPPQCKKLRINIERSERSFRESWNAPCVARKK